jgi:hypothetical protein
MERRARRASLPHVREADVQQYTRVAAAVAKISPKAHLGHRGRNIKVEFGEHVILSEADHPTKRHREEGVLETDTIQLRRPSLKNGHPDKERWRDITEIVMPRTF